MANCALTTFLRGNEQFCCTVGAAVGQGMQPVIPPTRFVTIKIGEDHISVAVSETPNELRRVARELQRAADALATIADGPDKDPDPVTPERTRSDCVEAVTGGDR